jgi:hypothetical protein
MITMPPPLDNRILVGFCGDREYRRDKGLDGVYRLSVDDFDDPDEDEISDEEIHLTCVRDRPATGDEFPFCFKLSTVSARRLIAELSAAIARREPRSQEPAT